MSHRGSRCGSSLRLNNQSEWIRIFDPRDWTIFVPRTAAIDTDDAADRPRRRRLARHAAGHRVGTREDPAGVSSRSARPSARRSTTSTASSAAACSTCAKNAGCRSSCRSPTARSRARRTRSPRTSTRRALFLFTDNPLPETSQIHMLVTVPGKTQPLSLVGKVSHTILDADDEPPGMGVVFDLDDAQREALRERDQRARRRARKGCAAACRPTGSRGPSKLRTPACGWHRAAVARSVARGRRPRRWCGATAST